jgi:hypothetical protein
MSERLQRAELGAGFVEAANEAYEHAVALAAALHKADVTVEHETSKHILRWGAEEYNRMDHKQHNRLERVTQKIHSLFNRGTYSERDLQMTAYIRVLISEAWSFGINLHSIQVPEDTVRWAKKVHCRDAAKAPFGTWPDPVFVDGQVEEGYGKQFLHGVALFALMLDARGTQPEEGVILKLRKWTYCDYRYRAPEAAELT